MTRVYVPHEEAPLFIPSAWTEWTYRGDRFRRHPDGRVYACLEGLWWTCVEETLRGESVSENARTSQAGV